MCCESRPLKSQCLRERWGLYWILWLGRGETDFPTDVSVCVFRGKQRGQGQGRGEQKTRALVDSKTRALPNGVFFACELWANCLAVVHDPSCRSPNYSQPLQQVSTCCCSVSIWSQGDWKKFASFSQPGPAGSADLLPSESTLVLALEMAHRATNAGCRFVDY